MSPNCLVATAIGSEKKYDGTPADKIVLTVTDGNGNPVDCTIMYRDGPLGEWTTEMPEPPTDASEQVVYYRVSAGSNYGEEVVGHAVVRVLQRGVTLVAGSAEKAHDGTPLVDSNFTVGLECDGFIQGEGVASVEMTSDSTRTRPGVS